ncbi:MAG: response regulator [bacterium]|jgi:CheY-like chemotaxis protein|nr:response regulator [bacterium]
MQNLALVVEDDAIIRSFVKHVLHALNFEILEAETEAEGWERYKSHQSQITFVYTDVMLGEGDGFSLYQRIRASSANLVVVLASGYPNVVIDEVFTDSHSFFLPKPFPVERLMNIAKKVHSPILQYTMDQIC